MCTTTCYMAIRDWCTLPVQTSAVRITWELMYNDLSPVGQFRSMSSGFSVLGVWRECTVYVRECLRFWIWIFSIFLVWKRCGSTRVGFGPFFCTQVRISIRVWIFSIFLVWNELWINPYGFWSRFAHKWEYLRSLVGPEPVCVQLFGAARNPYVSKAVTGVYGCGICHQVSPFCIQDNFLDRSCLNESKILNVGKNVASGRLLTGSSPCYAILVRASPAQRPLDLCLG